ncbi:hypothetical protein ACFFUR_16930 [Echinicola jeungdonensis]|uniref:Uncharacterized protein n=1 Tax=Echinicola jeungdonensis TaxID=709343 RepID=A0ABV5J9I8_9BACT
MWRTAQGQVKTRVDYEFAYRLNGRDFDNPDLYEFTSNDTID